MALAYDFYSDYKSKDFWIKPANPFDTPKFDKILHYLCTKHSILIPGAHFTHVYQYPEKSTYRFTISHINDKGLKNTANITVSYGLVQHILEDKKEYDYNTVNTKMAEAQAKLEALSKQIDEATGSLNNFYEVSKAPVDRVHESFYILPNGTLVFSMYTEQEYIKILIDHNFVAKDQNVDDIITALGIPAIFSQAIKKQTKRSITKKFGYQGDSPSMLSERLPGHAQRAKHPVTAQDGTLFNIIMNLNDDYKWTREAIADWIETLDEVPYFETAEEIENEENADSTKFITKLDAYSRISAGDSER
jgi:hypothetical protein